MAPEAFFLPVASGQRFCLFHRPAAEAARGALLFLHPFAEEMNKARRMVALQARQMAAAGFAVLQIDLHGCGDSSGDFGDATWETWRQDVIDAHVWLHGRFGAVPLWLWGLRVGCLLAASVATQLAVAPNYLFWQPSPSGKIALRQFLRLKAASEIISGEGKGATEALQKQLADGMAIEIAGYRLSPGLAQGLELAELAPPTGPGHMIWMELSSRAGALMTPASAQHLEKWQSAGYATISQVVTGPAFWQTTEIEEVPALLTATMAALTTASA